MSRAIPTERWAAFATVAAASRDKKVLVACSSAAVQRQYQEAIPNLGGNLANVIFRIISTDSPKERTSR